MAAPQISGYADLVEVGHGGFAVVYRARQVAFNRPVAVKVLTSASDASKLARFERECAAIGALSGHPHVVAVFDAGVTSDGSPYLSMEYLPRGSLADRIRLEGPIPADDVLRIGMQIAGAVQVAHEAGVLHRDIKPENVLVDSSGACKIADFGIAAVAGSSETATGTILGTVLHTAPEVLEGSRASVASDVYSLGSTLATLLLGHAPFAGDNDDSMIPVMMRVVRDPLPDLRAVGVPNSVAAAIELAMEKSPERRFKSAAAMSNAMRQLREESTSGRVLEPPVSGGDHHTLPPTPAPAIPPAPSAPPPAYPTLNPHFHTPSPNEKTTAIEPQRGRRRWRAVLVAGLLFAAGAGAAAAVIAGGDRSGTASPKPDPTTIPLGTTTPTTLPRTTTTTTTEAPTTTEPPTTTPPPPTTVLDLTLSEAGLLVQAKGFEVDETSSWRAGPGFTALRGVASDGREQIFFFAKGSLLGKDYSEPSWGVRITNFTDSDIDAAYSLYAANEDATCCDPIGEKVITFHFDGTGVTPQNGPPPTTDQSVEDHR